jgi:hypothetical protein
MASKKNKKDSKLIKYKNDVLNLLSKIPLFEGLPDCTGDNFFEAFKEVFSNTLFSTMPIWLSFVWFVWKSTEFNLAIHNILGHGELFMYSTSVLAPIFYTIFKKVDPNRTKKFPGAFSHIILVTVIFVTCSFAFGAIRSDQMVTEVLFSWSIWLYAISLSLIYLATVYSHSRPKSSYIEEINNEGAEMTAQLGRYKN